MRSLRALVLAAALGLSSLAAHTQEAPYPLRFGRPTTAGIERYVKEMGEDSVGNDFQRTFKVTFYEKMYFESVNMHPDKKGQKKERARDNEIRVVILPTKVGDELGEYHPKESYATITNEEEYLGYSLKTTKQGNLWNVIESNQFVRGVMIHETGHKYVEQRMAEMQMERISVSSAYIFDFRATKGTLLITEGIAEYCAITMGEIIQGPPYMPKTKDELFEPNLYHQIYYSYGATLVKPLLDRLGLAQGTALLLTNPPPTDEEILRPELYYARLKEPVPEKMEEDSLRFTSGLHTQRPRP